jgi:hypothetical protein
MFLAYFTWFEKIKAHLSVCVRVFSLIFCFLWGPDRLSGPHILLSNGYRRRFPGGQRGLGVKLATHLYLLPMSRMVELYLHSLICLHGIACNQLNTGTTLPMGFVTYQKKAGDWFFIVSFVSLIELRFVTRFLLKLNSRYGTGPE